MKTNTGTEKNAGRKPGSPENSSKSYVIIDKCDKCPVYAYEDVVCNDNLRALVVEGEPSDDVLKQAKMDIISEFAELSGEAQSGKITGHIREIYLLQARITAFTIAAKVIGVGQKDEALLFLKDNGIPVNRDWTDEEIVKKIVARVKNLEVRLKEERKKYEDAIPKEKGSKVTPEYFTEQLIAISNHSKIPLTKNIMMLEFAIRLRNLKKEIDYGKYHAKHRAGSR